MGKILISGLFLVLSGCYGTPNVIAGGVPETGKNLAAWYGCGSCHAMPGLPGAVGRVGPALGGIARQAYITGSIPNTPANLMRWIREPRNVDARTVMPNMGITEQHGRDIAAYLYTLE